MGEPSTHEFLLPAEIWHQIIDLLVVDDLWSAARCQLINKEMRDIALSDLTWRQVYEEWTQTATDPALTHWYNRFVEEGTQLVAAINKTRNCQPVMVSLVNNSF